MQFCDVTFSLGKKHILEKIYVKRHAMLVDPVGGFIGFFVCPHVDSFYPPPPLPQKDGPNQEMGFETWIPRRNFELPDHP